MLCPSRDTGEVSRGAGECPGPTVVNQRMVPRPGPGRGMWRGKETSPLCPVQHSRLLLEDPPLLSLCFHLHGVAVMSGLEPLPSSPGLPIPWLESLLAGWATEQRTCSPGSLTPPFKTPKRPHQAGKQLRKRLVKAPVSQSTRHVFIPNSERLRIRRDIHFMFILVFQFLA